MERCSNPYRESRRAAWWGICVNLALGGVKLLGGLLGHSLALLSDAVHSLVDAAVSGALLVALVAAERPPDREHPYGHGRLEAVAGAGIALVLLGLASLIAYQLISTIGSQPRPPADFAVVVAGGSVLCQELLYRYTSRTAQRAGSRALLATAWDYRLDAMGGIAVLIGLAMSRWAGWHWADHAAAALVAATVLWVGGGLLRDNVQSLIDHQADPAILDQVTEAAQTVPGVLAVEKLRVRRMGIEHIAEIHIEVSDTITVRDGHEIAHAVKRRIMERVPSVSDVVAHVEPYDEKKAVAVSKPDA
jgi:cation diffusion facilitator family transporter